MIDENLPTFYWKQFGKDASPKQDTPISMSQYGSEARPAYTIRYPDPSSPAAKNKYAVALYDSYYPEILYGEVLLVPRWTSPGQTAEEAKKNNGIPPPPQPVLPDEFTIQLYNPDLQIKVKHKPSTWNSSQQWEFSLPQQTFRQPSSSALDRTQNDPAALDATPHIDLLWKRESRMNSNLHCDLSGKSRNQDGSKKKGAREADIPIAFFREKREMTVVEPNIARMDIEDPKGLEVVLLLGVTAVKDVYFSQINTTFNVSSTGPGFAGKNATPIVALNGSAAPPQRRGSTGALQKKSHGKAAAAAGLHPQKSHQQLLSPQPQVTTAYGRHSHDSARPPASQLAAVPPSSSSSANPRPPITDARTQWEIDAETARLRQASAAQQAELDRRSKHERRKREKEDARAARKLQEQEDKAARKRREEVDRETERLRKQYGKQPALPPRPGKNQQPQKTQQQQQPQPQYTPQPQVFYQPQQQQQQPHQNPATMHRWQGFGAQSGPGGVAAWAPQQPPRPQPQPQLAPQQQNQVKPKKSGLFGIF